MHLSYCMTAILCIYTVHKNTRILKNLKEKNLFIKVNKNIGVEPSDTAKLTMVNHPQLSPPTHNIFSNMEASEFL